MGRLFSTLFSIILIALVVYNTLQVASLRREVATLKTQVAAGHERVGRSVGNTSLLGKAQEHIDLAKDYMLRRDFKHADSELNKGLQLIQRAGRETTEPYMNSLEKMERALNETRGVVDRLWKTAAKSREKGKGG